MNDQAILLYKQACEFAYKVCKDEGREGGHNDHIWCMLSTGKFAELLIKECARQARNTDLEDVDGGDSAVLAAVGDQIKKHFGIAE